MSLHCFFHGQGTPEFKPHLFNFTIKKFLGASYSAKNTVPYILILGQTSYKQNF